MPETSIHILSTKQLPQTHIDYAANEGIGISCKNFIRIEPVHAEALRKSLRSTEQIKTIIFTSEQAVKIVAEYIHASPDWNIYCIAGATLQAVRLLMPNANVAGTTDTGRELAELVVKDQVKEALFFCSNIRLNTIPDYLNRHNTNIKEVVVYNTIPNPHQVNEEYDGIMFFSPSGVESFFSVNKLTDGVPFFAIGHTTANALSSYPNPTIISERPEPSILIETIVNHYKALNAEQ
ncbi:MAG: uroporphyrinogen-III synthase [Sphingobacteriales bacterium]|nr:MAG: uroporphyrinogen-III synthase [Sphingobacteriales bacterium]